MRTVPTRSRAPGLPERIEWPTVAVAAAIYSGFGLVTWFYDALPWWLVLPLGGYLVAWHGSLQHEVVHGHPTPWPSVNEALIFPSLWLWLPFRLYRTSHLKHHDDALLTDPLEDPESNYVTADSWALTGPIGRIYLRALRTVAGRLVLEPPRCFAKLVHAEATRLARGDTSHGIAWLLHVAGVAVVLVWAVGICRIPLIEYVLLFAFPGMSLTLLRSYLEHRPDPAVGGRSVIVEAGPLMSLLYLNNNLHAVHHREPGTPWYRLPARYRAVRAAVLAGNGNYRYGNYTEIVLRYLVRPKDGPLHPFARTSRRAVSPGQETPPVLTLEGGSPV